MSVCWKYPSLSVLPLLLILAIWSWVGLNNRGFHAFHSLLVQFTMLAEFYFETLKSEIELRWFLLQMTRPKPLSYLVELCSVIEELVQVVWYILILKINFSWVENINPFSVIQSGCSARICAVHGREPVLGYLCMLSPQKIYSRKFEKTHIWVT